MKRIEAIIRPKMLGTVRRALDDKGLNRMTLYYVQGIGSEESFTEVYRGQDYTIDQVDKIKIEIFAHDEDVHTCVNTIMDAARTGEVGDGKIIVSSVDTIYRLRTAEQGQEAL